MKRHYPKIVLINLVTLLACGKHTVNERSFNYNETKIKELENKILELQGTQTQINSIINSDFATCPNSGDTADALINKICKIAQAATVEARISMKGELATFSSSIGDKIDAISNNLITLQTTEETDIANINTQIAAINTSITTITGQISTLQGQMTSANAAISALQTLTNSINGVLAGTVTDLVIGNENLAAGPVYESILRRVDKSRITAYVQANGVLMAFGANPFAATNGSAIVTMNLTTHGYVVGNIVYIQNATSGRGFSSADVTGEFTVLTVPNANSFTVTMSKNATSSGNFGGGAALVYKVIGRGMGLIWQTSDGADVAVRQATLGTKRYNFIVKSTGDICYDQTNHGAVFATIQAEGVNIVCK